MVISLMALCIGSEDSFPPCMSIEIIDLITRTGEKNGEERLFMKILMFNIKKGGVTNRPRLKGLVLIVRIKISTLLLIIQLS